MKHEVQIVFQTCKTGGKLATFTPRLLSDGSEATKIFELFTPLAQIETWSILDYLYLETSDTSCRPRWIERLHINTNVIERYDINELGHVAQLTETESRLFFRDVRDQTTVTHDKQPELDSYEFTFTAVDGLVSNTTRIDMYNCFAE